MKCYSGDNDCCNSLNKCKEGEGDCDQDSDCKGLGVFCG